MHHHDPWNRSLRGNRKSLAATLFGASGDVDNVQVVRAGFWRSQFEKLPAAPVSPACIASGGRFRLTTEKSTRAVQLQPRLKPG